MGIGRFFCVALPFGLTVASIVFLLVAALAGVTDKSLYIFRADVENLSISPANVTNFVKNMHDRDVLERDIQNIARDVEDRAAKTTNITAADLGLGKVYDVGLWGYCVTTQKGKRECETAKFNWAATALNTSYIENFGSAAGVQIKLPTEIKSALKTFTTVAKFTEIAFIVAFVALAAEIVFGIFSNCSRLVSCCTWIISVIAWLLVMVAAGLASAMGLVVVGAIKSSAKYYGVTGNINSTFFAVVWISAAFALGAVIFWVWTICCCKPEHRSRNKNRHSQSGEKLLPGGSRGYAPLGNDHEMTSGNYYNQNQSHSQYGAPRYPNGAPRSDLAYEPYSHRA